MSTARSVFTRLRVLGALLVALITCACAPQGNVRDAAPTPAPDPRALANADLAAGNYAAAARAYETLAVAASGTDAVRLRAMAALAYQEAGDHATADGLLGLLEGTAGADQAVATARARSLLHAGDAAAAARLAGTLDTTPLTPYQHGVHARTLGAAALATGDAETAATALVSAWRYPVPDSAREGLAAETWRAVFALPETALDARTNAAGAAGEAGWYELALAARRNLLDTTALAAATDVWRQAYPGHPAAVLVEGLLERSEALGVRPRSVALLLPFEATLRPAAQAVRDGFMTAWFGDGDTGSRPAVRVYSTADAELATVVDRAHADGAEFIVGPLRKDLVAELRADSDLAVGVLALNVVDAPGLARPGFYQFGLTPEDEAAQVAEHAARRGSRALLLVPDSTWGERLGQAYEAAWSAVGGTVLARVDYTENTEGYARAVREALAIDASTARAVALREHLDLPLHYEPRRRADAELILLAAFPGNARQIMPQLRYFGAGAMPVYATSHVYGGTRDAEGDVDLDGIEFGDMPWLFGAADPATRATVERHWQPAAATMARLYAFGIDAYRVLPYLAKLRLQPALRVPGVTGELTMDAQGVMHRKLTWLRFVGGVPQRVTDLSPLAPHDALARQ